MRYYVNYKGEFWDELEHLPMEGKTIQEIDTIYELRNGELLPEDVAINTVINWIDIFLTEEEKKYAESKGLKIYLVENTTGTVTYDPDGSDNNGAYCNEFAKVTNVGTPYPGTPQRIDHFFNDKQEYMGGMQWNGNYARAIHLGEQIVQPSYWYMDIPRLWKQGFTGAGLKIGVIDEGASVNNGHPDVPVTYGRNLTGPGGIETNNFNHAWGRISQLGANGNLKGICFNAQIYSGTIYNVPDSLNYLINTIGVDAINCSFQSNPNPYTKALIEDYISKGGIVVVSAGNNSIQSDINPMCLIKGVVAVGAHRGGAIYKFTDVLQYKQTTPVQGKGVDFIAPARSVDASVPQESGPISPGPHYQSFPAGTSMSAPVITGILCLLKQKYPNLSNRSRINLLKKFGEQTTSGFIRGTVKNLK